MGELGGKLRAGFKAAHVGGGIFGAEGLLAFVVVDMLDGVCIATCFVYDGRDSEIGSRMRVLGGVVVGVCVACLVPTIVAALPYAMCGLNVHGGDAGVGRGRAIVGGRGKVVLVRLVSAARVGGGRMKSDSVAVGSVSAGGFSRLFDEIGSLTEVGFTRKSSVIPSALRSVHDVREKEGMEVTLVPYRTALAGPIFAAGVVVAAGAVDVAEVDVGPK